MNGLALAWLLGFQTQTTKLSDIESSLLATIDQHFWDAKNSRWREMAGKDDEVFLWGYSVLLSTFAIGAKVDPSVYKSRMEQAFDGLERYWTKKSPGGYAVLPGQDKNPDRYYDDNAWVGLAAMEAFDATKDKKYLAVAKRAFQFVKSGEDKKLGGGIYWHENKKESKNACVNAPAAMLAFKLFLVTHDDAFRAEGERWFVWTSKLADKDLLIMDYMNLSGKIDQTKWSYNSACYIQASRLCVKSAIRFLSGAVYVSPRVEANHSNMLKAAETRWIDPKTKLVKNPGMFAMHLMEAIAPDARNEVALIVGAVFEKCRNEQGLLGEYWDRKPLQGEKLKLMYTASLLRTALLCRTR